VEVDGVRHDGAVTSGDDATEAHRLRLYHRLQTAAHELRRFADRVLADTGLSTAQLAVIAVIDATGPVSQRTVAEQLGLQESAITAMIDRLTRLDYVTRVPHATDGRIRLLHLTELGAATARRAASRFVEVNQALDEALGPEEVAGLAASLDRIRQLGLPRPGG
jgi:DNA-binding MarR family transcriptional regulator